MGGSEDVLVWFIVSCDFARVFRIAVFFFEDKPGIIFRKCVVSDGVEVERCFPINSEHSRRLYGSFFFSFQIALVFSESSGGSNKANSRDQESRFFGCLYCCLGTSTCLA